MKRMRELWELFGKKVRQINYEEFAINFWQSILSLDCKMIHPKWPFPSQQWDWAEDGCPEPAPCQANPALKNLSFKWSDRVQNQQTAHTACSTSWDSLPSDFLFGETSLCFLARADTAQINQLHLHRQLSRGINRNRNIFVLGGDLCQEATKSAWPCWLWASTHPPQQLPPTVTATFAGRHRNKLETFLRIFSKFLLHCSLRTYKIMAGTWCLIALNGL